MWALRHQLDDAKSSESGTLEKYYDVGGNGTCEWVIHR